jgi:hypothetical protein
MDRKFRCHRSTVGRILKWVANFSEPVLLAEDCILLDPPRRPSAAPIPPDPSGCDHMPSCMEVLARAGHLVQLFEHLAGLLRKRSAVPAPGPGLTTVLRFLFDGFRTVYYLTWVSPPLRRDSPPGPRAS